MNTLQELRQVFKNLGKEVTSFTGYSMVADGHHWGLLHDDPVRDGVVMAPADWRAYLKALKTGAPKPEIKGYITAEQVAAAVPKKVEKPSSQSAQITCPHCHKTGGAAGMRIFHFDRCKQKPQ